MKEFLQEIGLQLSRHEWFRVGMAFAAGLLLLITIEIVIAICRWSWRRSRGLPPTVADLEYKTNYLKREITALRKKVGEDHEHFRNIAAGWQSVAIAVGVVAGGLWTFTTFSDTRQRESAQLQLAKLELETVKRFEIDLDLKATQLTFPKRSPAPRFIRVDLSYKVGGNWVPEDRKTLDFMRGEFTLVLVASVDNEGKMSYYSGSERHLIFTTGPTRITRTSLIAGTSDSFTALQMVPRPGLYRISWEGLLVGPPERALSAVTYVDVK
jgi:hypothetical protein